MITVKLESHIKDGDNTNFKDINPGDFVEFSIPASGLDKEYDHGDTMRVGPLTGLMWAQDEDSFLMKVTGNPFSSKKPDDRKVYKVEYHYDFYDDYGDNPRSATFISSVLIHANSEDEAIDKVIEHNEDIWDKHYPYIDGDPYDFEVVGEWDSIEDYNKQYPNSNITLLENSKISEVKDRYLHTPIEYGDWTRDFNFSGDYLNRSDPKYRGYMIISSPRPYHEYDETVFYAYKVDLRTRNDRKTLIYGPVDDFESAAKAVDEYIAKHSRKKKDESVEDKVYVMSEYTSYPESGIKADSFYDKYKYYFRIGGIDGPNPTFMDDFRRYCTRAGIPPVYYSAWIKDGKPYYSNYGYLYLLKSKNDIQKVYDIIEDHDMLGIREENIYGPNEFNKDEWKLQDMDSDKDAYVIYSHPLDDKYYHSKNPQRYEKAVYLMKATNSHEAEREFYDYRDEHRGNGLAYFYKKMKKGVAERIFKNKKTEALENIDKVYVMMEYTAYPDSGIEADDISPLFIMDATNDAEAEKETSDYNWEHKDEVTRDHSYFYQEMTREEAYELLGNPEDAFDEYMPIREALEDDPEDAEQEISSADTSINSSKLPALFKMVKFDKGSINLDFGGGKFDNVAEYLKNEYGATNLVYDKYNRSSEHNREVLNQVRKNGGADTVTCSNVLNVIKEPEARLAVIKNCKNYLKPGGTAYFTVYEGKGNGNEGSTKAGYQLNRKTADYLDEIKSVFSNVIRKGKLIIAK